MRSTWIVIGVLAVLAPLAWAQDHSIKVGQTPPPSELREPFRQLLAERSVQVLNPQGAPVGEFWFRKAIPVKATAEQVKNGLTYREIEETTFLGAVRFDQTFVDFRKQKIKPGVYTLRFGMQPQDGDHMGTAPYPEFVVLIPAVRDMKPAPLEVKEMRELSNKAPGGTHPGIMLLVPNEKPAEMPKLVAQEGGIQALMVREEASAGGQKAPLGIGLTVVGHTTAE
jgi:hypothetical protein